MLKSTLKALNTGFLAAFLIAAPVVGSAFAVAEDGMLERDPRHTVLSGKVTALDYGAFTIDSNGEIITVETDALTQGEQKDMTNFFTEDMYVTVEGVMDGEDEIVASRITRGPYYDVLPLYDPPYN